MNQEIMHILNDRYDKPDWYNHDVMLEISQVVTNREQCWNKLTSSLVSTQLKP
ncbi:MAG: hypothetical protein HRT61_12090 [Ekhidna sp.]|nr:hypothetical protein [Ekhidna sp.]